MPKEKKPKAKRHHLIPKLLLEYFSNQEGQLWVHDFKENKSYQTTLGNVLCIDKFNMVKTKSQDEDDYIEQGLFSDIEENAADIIKGINENMNVPTIQEWTKLVSFVSLMIVRGPWFRQSIYECFEQKEKQLAMQMFKSEEEYQKTIEEIKGLKEIACGYSYDDLKKAFQYGENEPKISRTYMIAQTINMATIYCKQFLKMSPNIMSASYAHKARYIIGDAPFAQLEPLKSFGNQEWPDRIRYKWWFLPLSPLRTLFLNLEFSQKPSRATERQVARINKNIADNSTRQIVSRDKEFAWERDDQTISWSVNELFDLLSESKYSKSRLCGNNIVAKCRNDWKYLRGNDLDKEKKV